MTLGLAHPLITEDQGGRLCATKHDRGESGGGSILVSMRRGVGQWGIHFLYSIEQYYIVLTMIRYNTRNLNSQSSIHLQVGQM